MFFFETQCSNHCRPQLIIIIIIIINEKMIVAFSPRTTRTRYKVKKQNRDMFLQQNAQKGCCAV